MTPARRALSLFGEADPVVAASRWARNLAAQLGLSHDDAYRLDLCVSEFVTNIASYGKTDGSVPTIELVAALDPDAVRVRVSDDGVAFDPLQVVHRAAGTDLDAQAPGGHGIHLAREFSDGARYERAGGRNVLEFTIRPKAPLRLPCDTLPRGPERRRRRGEVAFPVRRADGFAIVAEGRCGIDRRELGSIMAAELFRDVPYAAVDHVLANCQVREYPGGAILLRPEQRNQHVTLVLRGRLRVHLDAPDSGDFVMIEAGDCVGEMSVIDESPVSAYVVADAGCRLLLIEAPAFLEHVLTAPNAARNLVSILASRMRLSNRSMIDRMRAALELQRIRRELSFAREIQASMLPRRSPLFPDHPEVDCEGGMRPALEVGGDFFDAFFVDSHSLFLLIGDVCGKGMPAALFMVRALTLLRSEASRLHRSGRGDIERLVIRVNEQLIEGNDSQLFVSLFCAVFDTAKGTLRYVNCGHNPPMVRLAGGHWEMLAEPRNPVAGMVEGLVFRSGQVTLPPESALVLYTDGVTEAEDADGHCFDEQRLLQALDSPSTRPLIAAPGRTSAAAVESARALMDAVFDAVEAFSRGHRQDDDVTLLVFRRSGAAGTSPIDALSNSEGDSL